MKQPANLMEILQLSNDIAESIKNNDYGIISKLPNYSMEDVVLPYYDTLSKEEKLAQLHYVYTLLYQKTGDFDAVSDLLVQNQWYGKILLEIEEKLIADSKYLQKNFSAHYESIKSQLMELNPLKTAYIGPASLIYSWPEKYVPKTRLIFAKYDTMQVSIDGVQYDFIKASKRNIANMDREHIYCINSYHTAESLKSRFNIRLMLPMVLNIRPFGVNYSNNYLYVPGNISRKYESLKGGKDLKFEYARHIYDIPYKYKAIYYDITGRDNYGLEDILSLMSYTDTLIIPDDGTYSYSPIYEDIEKLKDFLHIYTIIHGTEIVYDTRSIELSRLRKLASIPEGYFAKYITRDIYFKEAWKSMLNEMHEGKVNSEYYDFFVR